MSKEAKMWWISWIGCWNRKRMLGKKGNLNNALLLFSYSVVSDSLQLYGLQHTRLPCPSPSPRPYSNSCLLSQWCYPTISSSLVPFSSCLQYFSASGSFLMSQHGIKHGYSLIIKHPYGFISCHEYITFMWDASAGETGYRVYRNLYIYKFFLNLKLL